MAIGPFHESPVEMDELEQRIAAAQYPEGGLVFGATVGLLAAMVSVEPALFVGPMVGALGGYLLGRRYRDLKVASLRRDRFVGTGGPNPADDG